MYRNNNIIAALDNDDEKKGETLAEELLDSGDDPNKVDGFERNALHMAAGIGCSLPLFCKILGKIDNVNACDNEGCTALMYATHSYTPQGIFTALINIPGIDVNAQGGYCNYTALHCAVSNSRPDIVDTILLHDRVDTSLKDNENRTPLKLAIDLGLHECVKILRKHGAPEE